MTNNRALLNLDAIPSLFDHRVAPVTELCALGISSHTIFERCQPGGPWQRIQPNLVLLTDEPLSRTQCIHAALKSAGPKAVLTGLDALRLHGMSGAKLRSPIHILVPSFRRQPRLVDGVYFERTHQLPEPLHLSGFPVAPLPRATVDTCRRTQQAGHIEDLLAETIYKGKITPATLRDELDRAPTRGTALPRRKLAEIDDKVRSMARGWARRLVQQAGLPSPEWQVPITTPNGAHVATADAWWDEVGLAWEVDSYAFDLSPADATAALTRAARLTASGVLVVHTSPTQLREDPSRVADLLRGAYERAAARPRPEVKAQCPNPKPRKTTPTIRPSHPTLDHSKPDDPTPQLSDSTSQAPDPSPQPPESNTQAPDSTPDHPTPQAPDPTSQAPGLSPQPPESNTQAPDSTPQTENPATQSPDLTTEISDP